MRVIRPEALSGTARRRPMLLALSMLSAGALALELTVIAPPGSTTGAAVGAGAAAIGLGIGAAWLVRLLRPDRSRKVTDSLAGLLGPTFDDSYALVLAPRLAVRDAARLDGILVGPAGVRVLTVRDWEGRYRVRGRIWEFDAKRRGWVRCRTNPSYDAIALSDGVARWARDAGLPELPIRPAIVFPRNHSRVVLEEPEDEVVTSDNAPWWANSIGRVRRLDPPGAAHLIEAILDAAEPVRALSAAPVVDRGP
jgi:hypothetical protein